MNLYFSEIKNRMFLLLICWFSTVLILYFYKETILFTIIKQNSFKSKKNKIELFYFIFTDITEILTVYLKLITFFSFQIIFIYLIYNVFIFIIPALFKSEYLFLKSILKIISVNYIITIILNNYFLLNVIWTFLLNFQYTTTDSSFSLYFEAKLIEFINFYTLFHNILIIYFQFFSLLCFLLNFINISLKIIKKCRKLFYYFFLIFLVLLSYSELLILFILWLTVIFLYECFILFILLKKQVIC